MGGVKKGDFICAKRAVKQMQLNKNCDSEMSFSYFLLFCWDRLFTEISTAGFTYAGRKHQMVAANLEIASLNERA